MLFIGEFIALWLINIPYIQYFSEAEVQDYKKGMYDFTYSHQNPTSGLFVEPTIENSYRAVGSINFSSSAFNSSHLLNPYPLDNENITSIGLQEEFFLDYLFEKQNDDGSYSDINGLGNIYSTYKVIQTIYSLNKSYLAKPEQQNRVNSIINYLNNSLTNLNNTVKGFSYSKNALEPDIISTYYGIRLAKMLDAESILINNNESLTNFIKLLGNHTILFTGNYRYSNNTYLITAETSYFGIRAYLELNNTYTSGQETAIISYFSSLYTTNPVPDGGYRSTQISSNSDISSTFCALWALYEFGGITTPILTKTYIQLCQNPIDGGFRSTPTSLLSDFKSGWSAMNAIWLLENNTSQTFDDSDKKDYYDWLSSYQGMDGLFGDISLYSNYWGVSAVNNYNPDNLNDLKVDKILDFVNSCYNEGDGGYGSTTWADSSVFSTFCALSIHQMFGTASDRWLYNETATELYITTLQNPDGGFRAGEDIDTIVSLFGPVYEPYIGSINKNISIVESSYWATSALKDLSALNLIDKENLTNWILSSQNADGGFGLFMGFHSDVISTHYGLELQRLLGVGPLSKMGAIGFLKSAQASDGGFQVIPFLSSYLDLPSSFLSTYLGSISLYHYRSQPQYISKLVSWFRQCISSTTGGVGDDANFGGDLHNMPYGLVFIDDIRYDQAFDPIPWNFLIFWLMIGEGIILALIITITIFYYINQYLIQKVKATLGIKGKLNIEYLKKFPALYCESLNIYIGRKLIVDGVSLEIEHGEILGILGESGAGKSTFIKAVLGMHKYKGVCEIYGMDANKNRKKFRSIYGYVPQDLGKMYSNFTTLQNLISFGKQYGLTEREIRSKAKRTLRSLEIEEKIDSKIKNLSGGEKRRVSIAMALMHEPVFCILDEPTSGLDPVVRERLWLSLIRINEKFNTTLIVITHYPEEAQFCDKVCIFGRGRGMIDFGAPERLLGQLPGKGRSIELYFYDPQDNTIKRLENIEGIDKALENKTGTDYVLLTDLTKEELREKITEEFGINAVLGIKQANTKMEEYFRYRAMEVPEIE
ncbi:MAG: ATP-binding cassette domain-containing protein [Promethearchaeota archaeon]|nr:MAG: ATP-binding cassette domain-containing protein [Candidatus Lokiarchaeota archaeon]